MKKVIDILIIVGVLFLVSSCEETKNGNKSDSLYYNVDCILVEKNKCGKSKTMLIQLETKEFMYRELSNDDLVTDEMYYSYEVDDIMHFEYLRKDKFFGIDPDKDNF